MIGIIIGTRPSIIKIAPLIRELQKQGIDYYVVHTGQHYSKNMHDVFFDELGLEQPDFQLILDVTEFQGYQIAQMLTGVESILIENKPDLVLVLGDANFNLAGAIAANKLNLRLCHTESGLRSNDFRMPEEHNRRMIDHISDLLFAPTKHTLQNLQQEHVRGICHLTGNTIVDIVQELLLKANSKVIPYDEFILATIHRQENVDDRHVLDEFIDAFAAMPLPVVLPVHPRTMKRLEQFKLIKKLLRSNTIVKPALGYLDFLSLLKRCKLVLTDSGGVQEEATIAKKHVVVMRLSTERPEAVEAGFSKVAGTKSEDIVSTANEFLDSNLPCPNSSPFGDGHASERIVSLIKEVIY